MSAPNGRPDPNYTSIVERLQALEDKAKRMQEQLLLAAQDLKGMAARGCDECRAHNGHDVCDPVVREYDLTLLAERLETVAKDPK